MTTRTLRPPYDTPLRKRQKISTILPTRYRLARYRNHLKAWRSLAYFLRIWKASSVFRSTPASCQEFNDISARFSGMMLMDFVWGQNMDTEILKLRFHIGRTYFRPRFHIVTNFLFTTLHTTFDLRIWPQIVLSRNFHGVQLGHLLRRSQ